MPRGDEGDNVSRNALSAHGARDLPDVLHFAFPLAEHDEVNWGVRLHLPLQLFSGVVRNASAAIHAEGG